MLEAGALASHFTLLGLDGREYSIPRSPGDGPLLLVFFRAKCDTCDLAFPYINRLREAYPAGWRLWAVSQDDAVRSAEYRERFGIGYPVLIDSALEVSRLYDPPSTPTLFLVGEDGRVEYTSEGFDKAELNELSRRLTAHVGAPYVEVARDDDGKPAMKPGCMSRHLFPRLRA